MHNVLVNVPMNDRRNIIANVLMNDHNNVSMNDHKNILMNDRKNVLVNATRLINRCRRIINSLGDHVLTERPFLSRLAFHKCKGKKPPVCSAINAVYTNAS